MLRNELSDVNKIILVYQRSHWGKSQSTNEVNFHVPLFSMLLSVQITKDNWKYSTNKSDLFSFSADMNNSFKKNDHSRNILWNIEKESSYFANISRLSWINQMTIFRIHLFSIFFLQEISNLTESFHCIIC